jgi:hypothetical protein
MKATRRIGVDSEGFLLLATGTSTNHWHIQDQTMHGTVRIWDSSSILVEGRQYPGHNGKEVIQLETCGLRLRVFASGHFSEFWESA